MTYYEPTQHGALCHQCVLQECEGPVAPEINPGAGFLVIGEAPGREEVGFNTPFVGRSGEEIMAALNESGLTRGDASWTNALLCRPPENKLRAVLAKVRETNKGITKENRERAKRDEPPQPLVATPMECCRPRLLSELRSHGHWLPVGSVAAKALLGEQTKPKDIRGGMLDVGYKFAGGSIQIVQPEKPGDPVPYGYTPVKVLSTLHPAFVLRYRRWTRAFRADIARFAGWMRGELTWEDPTITWHPKAAELRRFLWGHGEWSTGGAVPVYAFDVETDGRASPLRVRMRCLAVGNDKHAMVIGFLTKDGIGCPWYTPAELAEVKAVLCEWLASDVPKLGHNAGAYDTLVCLSELGVWARGIMDSLLLHRLSEPELPHNLGYVASVFLPCVMAWKADREGKKVALHAESDEELHKYCVRDVSVSYKIIPPLLQSVVTRQQAELVAVDHGVQQVCNHMHIVGMKVSQERRKKQESIEVKGILRERGAVRRHSGVPDLNPGSRDQFARLLFKDWKLRPETADDEIDEAIFFTETGQRSVSDQVLRVCLMLNLTEQQRATIRAKRRFMRHQKRLGTYVAKLRPIADIVENIGWDDSDTLEEREYREKYGLHKRGVVWADGRVHAGYNCLPVTGRLSSSGAMNAQNFPKDLRWLIVPQEGNVFVGIDADQLELRIAAARWNLRKYLEAFRREIDPHSMVTAQAIFGDRFMECAGWPSEANGWAWKGPALGMRSLSKLVQYLKQYGGGDKGVRAALQKYEDENGELIYLHKSLVEVRTLARRWLKGVPEYRTGWAREVELYEAQGFGQEPVHGRRRDFADGFDRQKVINFPIQSAAAALINIAMLKVAAEIRPHHWGPGTGIVTQTHDALVIECPEQAAPWVLDLLNSAFNFTHPSLPGVVFTGKAEKGDTWKNVA